MSGTSLDGLDLCTAEFTRSEKGWKYSILKSETLTYPQDLLNQITEAYHSSSHYNCKVLDENLSHFIGEAISIHTSNLPVDLIGSHGHTLLHQPHKQITLQVGNSPSLTLYTEIPIVCDFRVQDVHLGGQGAPLVPIGDKYLFSEFDICVNLGGFANMSCERNAKRIAWDICPVNMGLNLMAERLGKTCDFNGVIARNTHANKEALSALNNLPYYQKKHPKSLGREWYESEITPIISKLSPEESIATLTHHAAQMIAQELERERAKKVIFTGGGAKNVFLMDQISKMISGEAVIPDGETIDFKEALIFGFLALLKARGENNILATVTGAKHDHSSGKLYNFQP